MSSIDRKFSLAEVLAFLLIIVQIAVYALMWFKALSAPILTTMDFIAFYTAGRIAASGDTSHLYNIAIQRGIQIHVNSQIYDPLIFNHPPYLTPLMGLVSIDNYVASYILWSAVRLLAMIICAEMIRRFLLGSGWGSLSALLGALGCMTFFPLFISFLGGQDTVFTLIGLLALMFGLLKKQDGLAGLGLAFASLTPTLAGAIGLPLLFSRRRAGRWFIGGMLFLLIYSYLLVGSQGVIDFLYMLKLTSSGRYYGLAWSGMYNLLGLLIRNAPALNLGKAQLIVWVASALSILSMCILWRTKRDSLGAEHIGMALVLSVFTSPHLHIHGLSALLLPALGLMVILYRRGYKAVSTLIVPVISIVFLLIFMLSNWSHIYSYLLMAVLFFSLLFFSLPRISKKWDADLK